MPVLIENPDINKIKSVNVNCQVELVQTLAKSSGDLLVIFTQPFTKVYM